MSCGGLSETKDAARSEDTCASVCNEVAGAGAGSVPGTAAESVTAAEGDGAAATRVGVARSEPKSVTGSPHVTSMGSETNSVQQRPASRRRETTGTKTSKELSGGFGFNLDQVLNALQLGPEFTCEMRREAVKRVLKREPSAPLNQETANKCAVEAFHIWQQAFQQDFQDLRHVVNHHPDKIPDMEQRLGSDGMDRVTRKLCMLTRIDPRDDECLPAFCDRVHAIVKELEAEQVR